MRRATLLFVCFLATLTLAFLQPPPAAAQAQSNAGDLVGAVTDPDGARVPGATVTVRNLATNLTRTTTTDGTGEYQFLVLPPGGYEVTVEATGFASLRNPEVRVSIGQRAIFDVGLELRPGEETVVVTTEAQMVETQRTAVADTITPRQIESLPINQRDYLNFTLLSSVAARDSAPSIGAAPTSGLNFGGQRGRSNQVSVDGADATDKSVGGVRATISQEAVQEFQITTNSYMPEFGRAAGGVINIVSKGGSNDVHGNVFGFLRHKSVQARNPFSTVADPAFTRVEAGFTLGGPIVKDRTFYFFSFETRQREEEGFSSIGQDDFGLVSVAPPADIVALVGPFPAFLTPGPQGQEGFVSNTAVPAGVRALYFGTAREASSVALNGITSPALGSLPIFPSTGAPLPFSFVQLNALRGNYPVEEETHIFSARLDHRWNDNNLFFLRANVSPSDVSGIQVTAQNQNFGQNAFSRTSEQSTRDVAIVAQNVTTFGANWVNEARFQFARRGLSYTPSSYAGIDPGEPLGGQGLGVELLGFAHFGREPFSRVDREEKRWQWTDNVSVAVGRHTFKFGGDVNFIQLAPRFANNQIFNLNFGGTMRFGALSAGTVNSLFAAFSAPGFTSVQRYGLGLPESLIQGIGDSFSRFNDTSIGVYFQDTWRIRSNFTFNYGIRWDGEFTPKLRAFNALSTEAEAALGVTEAYPRDWNNWQPRIGFAWDPWGDGKTAIRAAYGIFFDQPPLASTFLADTNDGTQSAQQIIGSGLPCSPATSVLANPACLNAVNIFQGILNTGPGDPLNFGYLPGEQRFDPFLTNSIFINQNFCPQPSPDPARSCVGFPLGILPWTLPVAADFIFPYTQQWNLTIEREFGHDFSLSVVYQGVKGSHFNRPRNVNASRPDLLLANLDNALRCLAASSCPTLTVALNSALAVAPPTALGNCDPASFIPGVFCFDTVIQAPIARPAAFNFFRPSGPNFAFTGGLGIPDAAILQLAQLAGYPQGPGFFVPFSDAVQQEATGESIYHGLTVNLRKRYGNHYQFLASYTWSHAIDDSTDLQSLLAPQDNRRRELERSNSTFDQRHRFVFNAIFESPYSRHDDGFWRKFLADFSIAPIFQVASGRPFPVLTGQDFNLDFGPFTDRPSVTSSGATGAVSSPFLPGVAFVPPTECPATATALTGFQGCTGNLGRNPFTRPETWQLDLRVARRIHFGERWNLELIADAFNLFNRFNVADVNALCDPVGGRCIAGQPTAAADARTFQFAAKLNW